jgi:hypothetical protein
MLVVQQRATRHPLSSATNADNGAKNGRGLRLDQTSNASPIQAPCRNRIVVAARAPEGPRRAKLGVILGSERIVYEIGAHGSIDLWLCDQRGVFCALRSTSPASLAPLRSRGGWNHHGIWTGKEVGLVTIVPLHSVMLSSRSLQYFHDFTASPCGADLGRLDDNVVSVFCVHRSSPPTANLRLTVNFV